MQTIQETDEYQRAVKKNGQEMTDELIAETMESDRYIRYDNKMTKLSILRAALSKATATGNVAEDSEPFEDVVFIFGGSDSYGTKRPVDYYALRKNGAFVKVSVFNGHITTPCKCRVKGNYSAKWGSVTPDDDNGITEIEPKTIMDCQRALSRHVLTTHDMDKLEKLVAYQICAFKGSIQWVNNTALFSASGEKIGTNGLLELDERKPAKLHPTMGFVLNGENTGYSITLNIPRQRFGSPVINIEDFIPMCQDAKESSPDKKKQVEELKNLLYGREVIGIGTVGKINPPGANDILYINCSVGFISEVLPDIPDAKQVEKLVDAKDVEPACVEMNKKERVEKANKASEPVEEETSQDEPATEEEVDAGDVGSEMGKYVDALVEFGKVNNSDPKYITIAAARKAAKIPATIDDEFLAVIKTRAAEIFAEGE